MTTMLLPAPPLGICYNTVESMKHNILETIKHKLLETIEHNILDTIEHNVLETIKHHLIRMRTSLCRALRLMPQSPQSSPKVQSEFVLTVPLAQQRDTARASHQRPDTTCSIKATGLRAFLHMLLHMRTGPRMVWTLMLQTPPQAIHELQNASVATGSLAQQRDMACASHHQRPETTCSMEATGLRTPQSIHLLQSASVATGALVCQTDMIRAHLDQRTKGNIAVTPALCLDQSAARHNLWNSSLNLNPNLGLNLPLRLVPGATFPRLRPLVFCHADIIPPARRGHD
ncbi:hypothetical protein HBH70_222600 [Parastagonospora nodorum]|nr:hypothetical protein HBI10_193730 [Parastagonospora nodorum]KAH4008745.1 hypothetical protein HBI13_232240 [Parastagonospora nodorum]KAH4153329.1 hypothetical protein HBH43_224530 [Parastagonospora nodorum]KAH4251318.1 hypothetical protein HBI03_225750 [Parastagonospora nodorum]KAH4256840.1 hypothetical protein HBI04_227380 [Parastagonospora nodorum]